MDGAARGVPGMDAVPPSGWGPGVGEKGGAAGACGWMSPSRVGLGTGGCKRKEKPRGAPVLMDRSVDTPGAKGPPGFLGSGPPGGRRKKRYSPTSGRKREKNNGGGWGGGKTCGKRPFAAAQGRLGGGGVSPRGAEAPADGSGCKKSGGGLLGRGPCCGRGGPRPLCGHPAIGGLGGFFLGPRCPGGPKNAAGGEKGGGGAPASPPGNPGPPPGGGGIGSFFFAGPR